MIDQRIQRLYQYIDSQEFNLLSLDVFDTTVYRCVARPTDVFFLLAGKLQQKKCLHASSSPESFVRERINAENRARAKKYYCTEVTLKEIYDEFPVGYFRNFSPDEAVDAELSIERYVVCLHPDIRDLLAYAKEKGLKTAFVSDTYFTADQIGKLVGIDVDHVILSCEYNVSKYNGLHQYLLDESGIKPERILHVGDNRAADIDGPEIFNIERFWFRKLPEKFEGLLERELPEILSERARFIRSDEQGLTFTRCWAANVSHTDYEVWGASVLGPIIGGFTDWIVDKCRAMELKHVFCLMREGDILKKVLDLYGEPGVQFHKLYISRFAALKAAIYDASEAELSAFVYRPSPQKLSRILGQLGLTFQDIEGVDDKVLSPEETAEWIHAVSNNPDLRQKVVRSSKEARTHLITHMERLLDLSSLQEVGIVDLGYKGTIQACLQIVLNREKPGTKTRGLYLVTGGDVYQTQATGATAEGWLAENGQPLSMAHTFMRSPEIVEQSLMAECGTTLGHDENGEPLLDEVYIPEIQNDQIRQIQKGMLTFCQRWSQRTVLTGNDTVEALRNFYQRICIRLVTEPLDIELTLFGNWEHDENFGSNNSRPLLGCTLDEKELRHASVHQLASLSSADVYWPCGLAKTMGDSLGTAVANVFMRSVSPDAFDSGLPPQQIIFYWDDGGGFNKKNARVDTYRLNNRNRVWKRFSLEMDNADNRMFGLSFGLIGEVVQFSGVNLHLFPEEGDKRTIQFEPDNIEKMGCRKLYGNLFIIDEDPALFVVPTPELVRFAGKVHVDVFFALITGVH